MDVNVKAKDHAQLCGFPHYLFATSMLSPMKFAKFSKQFLTRLLHIQLRPGHTLQPFFATLRPTVAEVEVEFYFCDVARNKLHRLIPARNLVARDVVRKVRPCALVTYVQICRQVFFNEYFIFHRGVCRFYITSCVAEFRAFGELLYVRTLCDASHGVACPPLRAFLDIPRPCLQSGFP